MHNINMSSEAASADIKAACKYPWELKQIISKGGYTSQVFIVDETGPFWKHMPARKFIFAEEKSAPGFRAFKSHLTLLLGSNAARYFKIKPIIVYHSENPRAMKSYAKPKHPVIWQSNRKAWITMSFLQD